MPSESFIGILEGFGGKYQEHNRTLLDEQIKRRENILGFLQEEAQNPNRRPESQAQFQQLYIEGSQIPLDKPFKAFEKQVTEAIASIQVGPQGPDQEVAAPAAPPSGTVPGLYSQEEIRAQANRQLQDQSDIQLQQYIAQQEALSQMPQRPQAPEPPEPFTLSEGQIRFDAAGNPIAKGPPKAPPVSESRLTPENVNLDGKPAKVLRDPQGNYFDVDTKQPVLARITPYDPPPDTAQRPLTAGQESVILNRLTTQWQRASEDVADLYRATTIMAAGMEAARAGDLNAGSQAILVTFQKFLDPQSVVRESEYARSPEGISMANRIRGQIDRLAYGGAGVPLDELETFYRLAQEINSRLASESGSLLAAEKKRIGLTADRYNLPQDLIFPDYDYAQPGQRGGGQPNVAPPPTAPGGGATPTLRFNPDTGQVEPIQ